MNLRRLLPALVVLAAAVRAQEDELPPDEVADLVDRYVERGEESLRQGNYEEARLRFRKALRRDPKNRVAHLGTAAAWRAVGAYDKAEAQLARLLEARPDDRGGRLAQARLDLVRGRTDAARAKADAVLSRGGGGEGPDLIGLRARLVRAEALASRGRRDDARTTLDFFLDYYERRYDAYADALTDVESLRRRPARARPIAEEMTLVARALRMYVELSPLDHEFAQNAAELVLAALKLDPQDWEAWIEYVRVFRVEREGAIAKAHKALETVRPRNPELADLYVEAAKSILLGFGDGEARGLAETALRINPNQTDARAIVARVMLQDNEYPEAGEQIEAGLAVNPAHRDLLALRATACLLRGDRDGFEEGMRAVLAVDRSYGQAYHLAGLVVASRQRRYDRAVELVRRGLEIDAKNFEAQASLGIFLANLGRAREAVEVLRKSKELLPYSHPIRDNFRKVLDYVLGSMTKTRTENFVIRFDPGEYPVLSLFMPDLLEECWKDMTKRYGFTPKRPVLVEVFPKADDFSVRTLGIPGIPALGACFGGLITLDSPRALDTGSFLWASTARHEFAHVISLQLSHGQVPRWFTEGLSVLEERPLDTGWGREEGFERQVYDAYHTGTLPRVGRFDAMFRGPRVAYAYYVGGLMLAFLQEHGGEKGIVEALRLYGRDRPMEEVFEKAFGLELESFDRLFREWIGKRVARYRLVPDYALVMADLRKRLLKTPDDGEALVRVAWAHYFRRRYVDAADYLDRARKRLGRDHELVQLLSAHLLRRRGRHEQARALYEAFFAAGHEDYDARMFLASYYQQEGEVAAERYVEQLVRAKADWPWRAAGTSPYALLRRHYQMKGWHDKALRELEEQAAILSKDLGVRLALAREYVRLGRRESAVRVLEEALRITVFEPAVHAMLLPLYREAGARKKAIRAARALVALRPEDDTGEAQAGRWLDLAEVYLEDGQIKEAKSALAEAEKLAGEDSKARLDALRQKLGQ